jgi:DNA-binding NarL/FixJ family response regulator
VVRGHRTGGMCVVTVSIDRHVGEAGGGPRFECRTTVLVVDDHELIRRGVRDMFEPEPDLALIAEAGDSDTAIELATALRPDVVLLDVEIAGGTAVDTVRGIRAGSPDSAVVILSMFEGPELLKELLDAGIRGYLLKSVARQELLTAIRLVVRDRGYLVLGVSRSSLDQVSRRPDDLLSPRELEVLRATAEGLSNAQIAARLSLAETTVKRHLRNIFSKLGAVSRIDAVNKAVAAAVIPAPYPPKTRHPASASNPRAYPQPN